MPCDLETTQADACVSGIAKLDSKIALLQTIAQLSCERADAEQVEAIVDSFVTRSGISAQGQIDAVTALVIAARDNGWWSKCDLIYPFVGGTAGAHAQNLKSSSFTITWNGTVTHDANGITGNGTTGYGDTAYIPSISGQWSLNSGHLSIYPRNNGSGFNRTHAGTTIVAGDLTTIKRTLSDALRDVGVNQVLAGNISNSTLALVCVSRTESTTFHYFAGNTDTALAVNSALVSTVSLYVLALHNNAVAQLFSNANLASLTAGSGLTFAEYQLMKADWQAFQTALGRAV